MSRANSRQAALLARLVAAVNDHDLDGVVACFAGDYVNETPAHVDAVTTRLVGRVPENGGKETS